jgi:peptidylprolyl isomerase
MGARQIGASGRDRRRSALAGALVLVALASGACSKDSTTKTAAGSTTTTSTTTAAASAAGKPCVATADALPEGAPAVPVEVGPAPTTLVTKDLKEGTGPTVQPGDTVTVNYIGVACSTGKIFDSSYTRGQTVTFPLSQVIQGWTDGIPGMKVGGVRLLGIPADQAYGSHSPTPDIAPDEALWFAVEVTATRPT